MSIAAMGGIVSITAKPISAAEYSKQRNIEVKAMMDEAGRNADKTPVDYYGKPVALSALAEAQHWTDNTLALQTFQRARQSVDQITDQFGKIDALKDIAQAFFEVDDMPDARQSFRDAVGIASKIPGDSSKNWVSRADFELERIGALQAKYEFLSDAQSTASLIRDSRTQSEVLTIIAEHQIKAEHLSAAIHTIQDGDSRDKAVVLGEVAEAQIQDGRLAEAKKTILDAQQAASLVTRPGAVEAAWSAVAVAQAKSGDVAGAVVSAAKTGVSFTRYSTLRAIVDEQDKEKDCTGAYRTAEMITDIPVRSGALQAVSEAQFHFGNTAAGNQTAQEAQLIVSQIKDISHQCLALYLISQAQIDAKDFAGARQNLQKEAALTSNITDKDIMSIYLNDIAESQITIGDLVGARGNINRCGPVIDKVSTLESIADVQLRAGNNLEACNTLKDASKTIDASLAIFQNSDIDVLSEYSHIVTQQERAGDLGGALKTLRKLHQAANKLDDPTNRCVELCNVVIGLFASH